MTPAVGHGAAGLGRMGRLCGHAQCRFGPRAREKFIGGWLAGRTDGRTSQHSGPKPDPRRRCQSCKYGRSGRALCSSRRPDLCRLFKVVLINISSCRARSDFGPLHRGSLSVFLPGGGDVDSLPNERENVPKGSEAAEIPACAYLSPGRRDESDRIE